MPNLKLFDESEDEDTEDYGNVNKLSINKKYAENYEKWRRKEEYQKLKDKYGEEALDSDSESSSDSDGLAEPDNKEFDKDFFRCLAAVRLRHPVAETKEKFFKDSYSRCSMNESEGEPHSLSIKEFQRNQLLNQINDGYSKNSGDKLTNESAKGDSSKKFVLNDNLVDDEESDDLFIRREKTNSDSQPGCSNVQSTQKNEVLEFLQGNKTSLQSDLDAELLKGLKKDWETKMAADDKFLMDYFVNQRYLEDEDETVERAPNHKALDFEPLEEDEKTLEKMEEYETKYRFRFEEPDEDFIRRYPRVAEDSLRKKDESRVKSRQRKKETERHREEQKNQEVKRLKALKKKEILERIERLEEVAGKSDIDFEAVNLDSDFDPDQHDATMSKIFGEDYYKEGMGENSAKPTLEDEELNREIEEEYEKLERLDDMTEGNFRYDEVYPNSYGLTTKEILYAKDAELNRWYSIKRALRIGKSDESERREAKNYSHRASLADTKKKILPSLFSEDLEEIWRTEEEKKRIKNQKKKERRLRKKEIEMKEMEAEMEKESISNKEDLDSTAENDTSQSNTIECEETKDEEQLLEELPSASVVPKTIKKKKNKDMKIGTELKVHNETDNVQSKSCNSTPSSNPKESESFPSTLKNNTTSGNNKKHKKIKNENKSEISNKQKNVNYQQTGKKRKRSSSKAESKKRAKEEGELKGISDGRLKAYGANPKKVRKYAKYKNKKD